MTKKKIILISIISFIIILNVALFGFVFRLRNQKVAVVGEDLIYSKEQIIETAGFENGKSIFFLDKEKATQNLESKYPYLKVIQIKTTDLLSVEIKVRARYATYYVTTNSLYFILDEDLKVLEVTEDELEVSSLIKIEANLEGLSVYTSQCDFLGSNTQKNICYNLYTAVYTTQLSTTGEQSHIDMCNLIKNITFSKSYTQSGDCYTRLIITTTDGFTFDIGRADDNLQRKINICFTALKSDKIVDKTNGTIRFLYNLNLNDERIEYLEP